METLHALLMKIIKIVRKRAGDGPVGLRGDRSGQKEIQ